ncbi:hypothetical protein LJC14_00900 [Treponema sp. OttesenSCG-928-L16]|nr:hypothetical protein [Treponema sp. OttesenSCG-928-L16]
MDKRKKSRAAAICGFVILVYLISSCASGGSGEPVERAVFSARELRSVSVYVVSAPSGESSQETQSIRLFNESVYVPQGLAAYFPAEFNSKDGQWECTFDMDFSYRIMSRQSAGPKLDFYTLEAAGSGADPEPGKRYTVSFTLSDLGGGSSLRQPALYALEKAAKQAGAESGYARLESINFYTDRQIFESSVVIMAD